MLNKANNIDLTKGVVAKQLMLYFVPILLGSLFQQLYTTVYAIILGQFAGKIGLASIDAIYSLIKLPVNFFVGLSTGATILISQYFGAGNEKLMSKAVHTGIYFAIAGGAILSVTGVIFAPVFLNYINVPCGIYRYSLSYAQTIFAGLVLSLLYNIGSGILRAVGDSKTPFYILIISEICNIILDFVFIAGLSLNSFGAALATVISQGISAVLIMIILSRTGRAYRFNLFKINFDKAILASIFRIGLPVGFQSALYPVANMMIQSSINSTGTDNIAAWALCGKLDFMVWLVTDSLAAAISTFVAQNYGAKKHSRMISGVRSGMVINMALVAGMGIILYFFSVPLGNLFINSRDFYIAEAAGDIMRFFAPIYILYVIGEVYSGAIRGTGKTFKPMVVTLVGTCAIRILWVTFFIPDNPDIFSILWCYPISWGLTAGAFFIYYRIHERGMERDFLHRQI